MDLADDLKNLQLSEAIFREIKYFVSGEVHNKVLELLKSGGAERMNYFSDYVTHLICGEDAEETDLSDANELYEIPAISTKWVFMCAQLKRIVNTKSYLFNPNKLFSNLVFCFSKLSKDRNSLWAIVTYHGGVVQLNFDKQCTHLITTDVSTDKYNLAINLGPDRIVVVTPDWVVESVRNKQYMQVDLFHPKLIVWPKVVKHESTTAITGFEPEQSEMDEKGIETSTSDSTQALLDKLKQRMPWNQPQPTTVEIAPPNVVAPTYTGPKLETNQINLQQLQQRIQQQQQVNLQQQQVATSIFSQPQVSLTPNQVPRSIVHHTAQSSQQNSQFSQGQSNNFTQSSNTNQIGFNRLLDQLHQQRPSLQLSQQQFSQQQIRAQINQANTALAQNTQTMAQSGTIINQQPTSTSVNLANQPIGLAQQANRLNHLTQQGQIGQPQIVQQGLIQRHILRPGLQQLANRQLLGQNQLLQQQLQQGQIGQPQVVQNQMNQNQLNQQQIQNHLTQQQVINQQQQQINQQMNQQQIQLPVQAQLSQQLNQTQAFQPQQVAQSQPFQQQQQQIVQPSQTQLIQQNQTQIIQQNQNQIIQQNQTQIIQQNQPQILQQTKIIQNQFGQQQIITQTQSQQQFTNAPVSQQFAFNQQQPQQQVFSQQQQIQTQQQTQFGQNQSLGAQQQILGQQPAQQILSQQVAGQQQQIISQQQNLNGQQQHISLISQQAPQQMQQNAQQPTQTVQFSQTNLPNQTPQQRPLSQIWQQQTQQPQPQQPQQQIIRQPANIVQQQQQQQQGPRVQWSPNPQSGLPQRQFIHLDAQTHQHLQRMAPEQRALFVAKLQKQRQLYLQQRQQLQMQQQRGGHIVIRSGPVPPGLNHQQQMQWLHQQAKQQGVVLQSNIQQQTITNMPPANIQNIQHTPGLSPIQQPPTPFAEQNPQLQLQRQQFRLQQLQLQRDQAQKATPSLPQPPPAMPQQNVVRPIGPPQPVEVNNHVVDSTVPQNPLVVNAKTKTALANMLSIRLQSGGSSIVPATETITEPSAAGTLRLMTAQHNAALNSNNRPQDILALQQRRPINGPNTELARPAGAPSVPPNPQEPPKLQYSPRNNIPLQHRPGPFYGHNPNLKLPPDLFLLGCIFVVVELERFLEESIPGWQQKIEKHGGEIEKQYCSRVTHVLCETQRHGVVMQALRDYKRCVTLYWLSDVINRKQVLPPWTALHLPMMYMDTAPASKHLICLCGFTGTERNRVKNMIKYTGATFTSYFSKHNTLLIAAKAEGPKYVHAKKWGTPVVNIQWLTDVMLGNFSALNQMDHIKYQQFSSPPNFSFDPMLVPNLMHAWKMPINISQESYEKVKRSSSPVVLPKKVKKMKTEHIDESETQEDSVPVSPTHRILFSMCSEPEEMKKTVKQLGGSLAMSHQDCTHLVMPQLARTNKLLHCVCLGTHILPESWLRDSVQASKFLDESNYSLDTKEFNSEYKCDFQQTLATKNRNRLLEGKYFFITPSVYPSKKQLVELVQSCGGIIEKNRRSFSQIEATNINSPYSYVILTHENDLHLVADLLRNKKDNVRIVCNVELILSAVLRQTFEVEPYAVKVL